MEYMVIPLSEWRKPALRVILSGGRSPESNPEGDRRSGSPIVERTNPVPNYRNGKTPDQHIPSPLPKRAFERGPGKTFLQKSFPRRSPPIIPSWKAFS